MFRYKSGISLDYDRQGYVYFLSKNYKILPPWDQEKIRNLCCMVGRQYWKAVLEFVTTDANATYIEHRHNISKATLYRMVRSYYEEFPDPRV